MSLILRHRHAWDLSAAEARAVQEDLRHRVEREDRLDTVRTVGGIDVGFEQGGRITRAAVAVLDASSLELIDWRIARRETGFPYVPGLLSFRELPAVLDALQALPRLPDLLLVDGQGLAHPRRLGIACHLGVLLDHPSIGVGKSRLVGRHPDVPDERGAWVPLTDEDETVGAVLRTRVGVKPIFVSVGHRVSLETAVAQVMGCTPRYRLPETTRWADRIAGGREPSVDGDAT